MKQSILSYTFIITLLLAFSSCEKEPEKPTTTSEDVTLSVNAKVEDQSLVLDSKTYDANKAPEGFRISKFNFYLSDIRLFKTVDGQTLNTSLADVAFFAVNNEGKASTSISNVPVGEYEGIKFNLGLTAEQDESTPADYAGGHPLSRTADYWHHWKSYIFMKIEGKVDTLKNNREDFDVAYTFHVGKSKDFAKEITLTKSIKVNSQQKAIPLQINLASILGIDQGTAIDLIGIADHQNGKAATIMKNAEKAFSITD